MNKGSPHRSLGVKRDSAWSVPCVAFFDVERTVLGERDIVRFDVLFRFDFNEVEVVLVELVLVPAFVLDFLVGEVSTFVN